MRTPASHTAARSHSKNDLLPKALTGIHGLDEITGGGLPRNRSTLVCGGAGCGKTLLGMEFLVRGATEFGEPGVFLSFEENAEELAQNVASLGFDVEGLVAQKKLLIDFVHIERSEIEETGEFDLEGLFIRLNHAIDSIGARRVVIDAVVTLFAGLSNEAVLRSELRRLFRWMKDKPVTALITAERGDGTLTRYGLEEYISDCVIVLDHRVSDQLSTRRLRILKYRGTTHGTNEYPYLIDEDGFSVLPITSVGLQHDALDERVSSGVQRLDAMLDGKGIYRGSSVLISGMAGTGKSSIGAHFVDAACRRGERCLYFAFEESESQIVRNMRSIGLDLATWTAKGLLRFHATRPSAYGLEMHLAMLHKRVNEFGPALVVADPITSLLRAGTGTAPESMLMRLIDFLKSRHITAILTEVGHTGSDFEASSTDISSLIDTWIRLRNLELGGERNRGMYILKSRGMAHSHQIREFLLTSRGIEIKDVYAGSEGVLTGSMRLAQEAREQAEVLGRQQDMDRRTRDLEQTAWQARSEAQSARLDAEEEALRLLLLQEHAQVGSLNQQRKEMAESRHAGKPAGASGLRARKSSHRGGPR